MALDLRVWDNMSNTPAHDAQSHVRVRAIPNPRTGCRDDRKYQHPLRSLPMEANTSLAPARGGIQETVGVRVPQPRQKGRLHTVLLTNRPSHSH